MCEARSVMKYQRQQNSVLAAVLRYFLVVLTTAFLAGAAARAEEWPVARGPSHEPSPYAFRAGDLKQLPKDFLDDAPACIVYSSTTHLIEDDGTVEAITHEVIHFNGRKGIEKLGEYRKLYYEPTFEKLTLNDALVHKADGRIVAIEPAHIQLRDLNTDYAVYTRGKQLIISFPNLEVGDTIDIKWSLRGRNPEHQGQFFTRYNFGDDDYPVGTDELRIRLPKGKPFKFGFSGGKLEPIVTQDEATRLYRWRAVHRRELPKEEDLPPKEE